MNPMIDVLSTDFSIPTEEQSPFVWPFEATVGISAILLPISLPKSLLSARQFSSYTYFTLIISKNNQHSNYTTFVCIFQMFLSFFCGEGWNRTNIYGFSVRRIDHLCHRSVSFVYIIQRII